MMNIGTNPTVDGQHQSIEVHFFDYDEDLYHQQIQVNILHWIREEHKFASLEELKEQLKKDKKTARILIKE